MKGLDPLQMLTSVCVYIYAYIFTVVLMHYIQNFGVSKIKKNIYIL